MSRKISIHNNKKRDFKKQDCFVSLFYNAPMAIAMVDTDFKILEINESFTKLFHYTAEEAIGRDITDLLAEGNFRDASFTFRETILEGEYITKKVKRTRKDGVILDVTCFGFPLKVDEKIVGAFCVYSDITEFVKLRHQFEMLLRKDPLTGLFNRDAFIHLIKHQIKIKADEKLAVLFVGINQLREIDEVLGHDFRTEILRMCTTKLLASVDKNYIVARYREDIFAVLLTSVKNFEEIKLTSQKIIDKINTSYIVDSCELQITASIGISIYPEDGIDSISLLRKADIALQNTKELYAKDVVLFDDKQEKKFKKYFWIKNYMAKALANGEFYLDYQPIYDINMCKIVGIEALLRWNNENMGFIPPDIFIPIAEETGLIKPIGKWVLKTACRQNKLWQDKGYDPVYISVNVSVLQIEDPNFYNIVVEVLEETQLNPRYLQLEITETFFTQNYKLIEKNIRKLRQIGINFAIDDFGTGYSSYGQLLDLNISTLKIDRSFIDGVDQNVNKSKIVKAVISLADSFSINLTAEGVETKEELKFLKDNQCAVVQGYLLSKPLKLKEIENLLTNINDEKKCDS